MRFLERGRRFPSLAVRRGPAVFFYANFTLWNGWLVRKKRFGATTWLKLNRRLAEGAAQMGLTQVPPFRLDVGELFGRFVFNLAGVYFLFQKRVYVHVCTRAVHPSPAEGVCPVSQYSLLPTLLDSAGLLLPTIMFNRLFGKEQTGYFDLCMQALGVPRSCLW